VIAIPPITAAAIEHLLGRLIQLIRSLRTCCRCEGRSGGCAELTAGMAKGP
jgi:hypothetical protein